jgi:hypothetical protein
MRILAIDLGTKTGWALFDNGVTTSGTWVLAKPSEVTELRSKDLDRCCDFRPSRLREHLTTVTCLSPLDLIIFEDVQFATSLLQVQLWSSLRSVLWMASDTCKVKAVDVGTLKKFATGKGNADKEHMLEAALAKGKGFFTRARVGNKDIVLRLVDGIYRQPPVDDNEVDAWHLLQLALKECKCP